MKYLLDTHTIYWFFENPKKLGKNSLKILSYEKSELLIPSIVLAELKYIFKKYKMLDTFRTIFQSIIHDTRCFIIPLDDDIVERMPTDFEIHDSIIIASAKYFEESLKDNVLIVTCDREIENSELVKTFW